MHFSNSFAVDSAFDQKVHNRDSRGFGTVRNLDYRILASIIIAVAIVSSVVIFHIMDIEQQLRYEQSRYIPERLVFVDGKVSEFFDGTQVIKKFSSQKEVQRFITALATSNTDEYYVKEGVLQIRIFR